MGINNLSSLVAETSRSKQEWILRLGIVQFESLISIGALLPLKTDELNGFVGLFDFGYGFQEYELRTDSDEGVIAYSQIDGVSVRNWNTLDIAFIARPEYFFLAVAKANKFEIEKNLDTGSVLVAVAKKIVSKKVFKMLMVLDESWISSFGSAEFVNRISKGCESLILLTPILQPIFPWSIEEKNYLKTGVFPAFDKELQIPRDWICHPKFGIPTEAIAEIYQDKKIVFDEIAGRIFMFGKEIILQVNSRPYNFIKGQLLKGPDSMDAEIFSKEFLGDDGNQDPKVVYQQAKAHAKLAIEKALADTIELKQILFMLAPPVEKGKRGLVSSNLNEEDFIFIPSN